MHLSYRCVVSIEVATCCLIGSGYAGARCGLAAQQLSGAFHSDCYSREETQLTQSFHMLQVLTGGLDQLSDNLRPAWDLAWQCYNSKPG